MVLMDPHSRLLCLIVRHVTLVGTLVLVACAVRSGTLSIVGVEVNDARTGRSEEFVRTL